MKLDTIDVGVCKDCYLWKPRKRPEFGDCHLEPEVVCRVASGFCSHFTSRTKIMDREAARAGTSKPAEITRDTTMQLLREASEFLHDFTEEEEGIRVLCTRIRRHVASAGWFPRDDPPRSDEEQTVMVLLLADGDQVAHVRTATVAVDRTFVVLGPSNKEKDLVLGWMPMPQNNLGS